MPDISADTPTAILFFFITLDNGKNYTWWFASKTCIADVYVYFIYYHTLHRPEKGKHEYALVWPFLYFDPSTSARILRHLYVDLFSSSDLLLVDKYSFGRSKVSVEVKKVYGSKYRKSRRYDFGQNFGRSKLMVELMRTRKHELPCRYCLLTCYSIWC